MRRVVALLLILTLLPVVLFSCGLFDRDTSSDSASESGTRPAERESDPKGGIPSVPLDFAQGEVLRLFAEIPENAFGTDGTVVPACRLAFEFYRSTRTFSLELSVGEKHIRAGYDGEHLCVPQSDGDGMLVLTPEAFLSLVGGGDSEAGGETPLLGMILKELLFGTGDVGILPLDRLLPLLPEDLAEVIVLVREVLPEEAPFPAGGFSDGSLFDRLLALSEKGETEDGGTVYTADVGKIAERFRLHIEKAEQLLGSTPASLFDEWHGEAGAYRTAFNKMRNSVGTDVTVGEFVGRVIVSLNEKGFRVTEKQLLRLADAVCTLLGKEIPGGGAEAVYRTVSGMTLDRFLAMYDPALTADVMFGKIDRCMTESSILDLFSRFFGEERGEEIRTALKTLGSAADSANGSFVLTVTKDGKIRSAVSEVHADGRRIVTADLGVSDTASVTAPVHPSLDGVTVKTAENGDLVFSGLPDGASLRIDISGKWRTRAEKRPSGEQPSEYERTGEFTARDGYPESRYLRVGDGSAVVDHRVFEAAEELIRRSIGIGTDSLPQERIYCDYRYAVTVCLVLSDGTECILTPQRMTALKFALLFDV